MRKQDTPARRSDFSTPPASSLELHINAAASGIDTNALLSGGNADDHTGLICHECAGFPSANSHAARARTTDIVMPVKILKMLEVENLAVSGRAGNPDLAYGQSLYFNRIIFALVGKGSAPGAEADTYCDRFKCQSQSSVLLLGRHGKARQYAHGEQ